MLNRKELLFAQARWWLSEVEPRVYKHTAAGGLMPLTLAVLLVGVVWVHARGIQPPMYG